MLCNVGKRDRAVRVMSAILLIGGTLYFIPSPIPKTLLLIAAMLLLMSGWIGICLIYKLLGINTATPNPAREELSPR